MADDAALTPKKPTWKQALLMLGAGILLGFGGCATFNSSLTSGNGYAWGFGSAGFLLGVYLTVRGAVRIAVVAVGKITR
jgi:hypothetical protein